MEESVLKSDLPEGVGQLPQWWMDLTPHDVLDSEEYVARCCFEQHMADFFLQMAAAEDARSKGRPMICRSGKVSAPSSTDHDPDYDTAINSTEILRKAGTDRNMSDYEMAEAKATVEPLCASEVAAPEVEWIRNDGDCRHFCSFSVVIACNRPFVFGGMIGFSSLSLLSDLSRLLLDTHVLLTLVKMSFPIVTVLLVTSMGYQHVTGNKKSFAALQNQLIASSNFSLEIIWHRMTTLTAGISCITNRIAVLAQATEGIGTNPFSFQNLYARFVKLAWNRKEEPYAVKMCIVRCNETEITRVRSNWLIDEALALAPTHFGALTVLSGVLFIGLPLGTAALPLCAGVSGSITHIFVFLLMGCYATLSLL